MLGRPLAHIQARFAKHRLYRTHLNSVDTRQIDSRHALPLSCQVEVRLVPQLLPLLTCMTLLWWVTPFCFRRR